MDEFSKELFVEEHRFYEELTLEEKVARLHEHLLFLSKEVERRGDDSMEIYLATGKNLGTREEWYGD